MLQVLCLVSSYCVFMLCSGFESRCAQEITAPAPMLESEKEALFSVLGSLVGSDSNVSGIYPDPCGTTPIQGSSCDQFGYFWFVTVLNLAAIYITR